jgi:hypothetical protein
MKLEVDSCDLGLSAAHGRCAIDTEATTPVRSLTERERMARLAAAGLFAAVAAALWRWKVVRTLAVVSGWFSISHAAAAATGYGGCPELGAVASLFAHRPLATECGPWDLIDERLVSRTSRAR